MAKDYRVGPCRVFVAPSLTSALGSWVDLGETRGDVVFRVEPGRYAFGRTDQKGVTPLADAVWDTGPRGTPVAPMLDKGVAKLGEYFPGAVRTTASGEDALGFGNGPARVTPVAFSLVPVAEYTAGSEWADADHAIWLAGAVAVSLGEFVSHLPDGDDAYAGNVLTVEFRGVNGEASLPSACRFGGIGDLRVFGVSLQGLTP